ncbi:MAG: hypothetical protein K0Q89_3217 [Thermomicrobiales bacterium]|nr:hypothetical protein [Thermomicrobiales bacterium]
MDADDVLRVELAHERGLERTDVSALDTIALVTESGHQLGECLGDAAVGPSSLTERGRKPVTRNGRNDDMKGIGRIAAVRRGVGQRSDEVHELDERARPAMDEHQWSGVRLAGASRRQRASTQPTLSSSRRERPGSSRYREVRSASECGPAGG